MQKAPHRDPGHIKRITVDTRVPGVAGWVVTLDYHDDMHATYSIDPAPRRDMLQAVTDSIKRQLEGANQ